MIPATDPDMLDRKVRALIKLQNLQGFLLSGGSNRRNEIKYQRFYPVIEKLKRDFPYLKIAIHPALTNTDGARTMADAGMKLIPKTTVTPQLWSNPRWLPVMLRRKNGATGNCWVVTAGPIECNWALAVSGCPTTLWHCMGLCCGRSSSLAEVIVLLASRSGYWQAVTLGGITSKAMPCLQYLV